LRSKKRQTPVSQLPKKTPQGMLRPRRSYQ
jgi:hypothetical protein